MRESLGTPGKLRRCLQMVRGMLRVRGSRRRTLKMRGPKRRCLLRVSRGVRNRALVCRARAQGRRRTGLRICWWRRTTSQ